MLDIRELFRHAEKYADQTVEIGGWVRTIRDTKAFGFIECNDGTFFKNVQIVFAADTIANYKEVAKLGVGTAIVDRKSTRLNSSHITRSRMPSSA